MRDYDLAQKQALGRVRLLARRLAVPLKVERILNKSKRFALRVYNSERKSWDEPIVGEPGS